MRVALILADNVGFSPVTGGGVNILATLYRHLPDIDMHVIACPSQSEYQGFRIRHVPLSKSLGTIMDSLPTRVVGPLRPWVHPSIVGFMVRRDYDALHVLNRPLYPINLRRFNKTVPIGLIMHNDHFLTLSTNQLVHAVDSTDAILCVSEYLAQGIVKRFSAAKEKIRVIPYGVDPRPFASARELGGARLDKKHVLFIGRLIKEKGVHLLIEAMGRVVDRMPTVRLTIVGAHWYGQEKETQYIASLREASRPLRDRITFAGSASHDEVPQLLAKADVLVSPSIWQEPTGHVNIEAMAAGVPIVTSNRGGIPEVVGDAALIVEPEDTNSLADAIIRILEFPDLAEELARRGQARVRRHFDWAVLANQYRKLFLELVKA